MSSTGVGVEVKSPFELAALAHAACITATAVDPLKVPLRLVRLGTISEEKR
jgi:hypothetical protein